MKKLKAITRLRTNQKTAKNKLGTQGPQEDQGVSTWMETDKPTKSEGTTQA